MKVEIKPSHLFGVIKAPASKSMAHRLLICAGLCDGESIIENVAYSQDILATLDCLEALGAEITREETSVKICGVNPFSEKNNVFNCRESGSTLRFFIPLAMLSEGRSLFKGSVRLMERPMEVYEGLSCEKGLYYKKTADGIVVGGKLSNGEYSLRGDISSQFITGLLLALPLCYGDSRLILTGKAESLSYIDMTIEAQRLFGVHIKKETNNTFYIEGSQSYKKANLTVEGDYSNAAFADAFNYLGGSVDIIGLNPCSKQGDRVYRELFEKLSKESALIDVSDCPDLAPILMSLACHFHGAKLTGTRRLKLKESDRAEVMKKELVKFGAEIETGENEVRIYKKKLHPPSELLYGHNDHRVVMSLAVLASAYSGIIDGCEAVAKSYPDFFSKMVGLGLEVNFYDN